MQQDLCELGLQGPAGCWDGGESSELAWVCVHMAGHCQQAQHPHTSLLTKGHPVCVSLPVKQNHALGSQHRHSSLCSLSPPSTSYPGG